MQDTTRMQAMQKGCAAGTRRAAVSGQRRLGLALLLTGGLLGGCGMGGPTAEGSAALLGGMPKCDASLLHPRIEVGAAAGLPGKMIIYVDGVMACVDDAARVDQLVMQIEGRGPGSSLNQPAAAASPPVVAATPVVAAPPVVAAAASASR